MSNLGLGVMIGMLGGNKETVEAIKSSIGKTITKIALEDNKLKFKFSDDTYLYVWDGGQSCCEHRYMRTDDDMQYYVGSKLMNLETKDAPPISDPDGECHEVRFLDVTTDKGVFQMANHNEHNGYYGGFWMQAMVDK